MRCAVSTKANGHESIRSEIVRASWLRQALAVLLLTTVSAFADESLPEAGAVLRLPTPAGHVVADVVGGKPMKISPLDNETKPVDGRGLHGDGLTEAAQARNRSRATWLLRGWVTPEEFIGREETGIATDTWRFGSWRVDAAVIRTF